MDETLVISQSLGHDIRTPYLPFTYPSFESGGGTLTPGSSWAQLVQTARYGPGRCPQDPLEKVGFVSTGSIPCAPLGGDASYGRFEAGSNAADPPMPVPKPLMDQLSNQVTTTTTTDVPDGAADPQDPGAKTSPGDNGAARDATSSGRGRAVRPPRRRARRATSASRSTSVSASASASASVDPGRAAATAPRPPDIKLHRERNRAAARKCRQKAKRNTAGLQRHERELSHQNAALRGQVGSLRREVLDLKTEILRHAECNSCVIQTYIVNAANRPM
ncbi:hypothetical protein SAMD00023353_0202770 [Rosellinia necatrix]|uniref:BZIP domain-containing protein n=1 Tax=Rosellinia necatrix TaxID=77044 RepID=A0A1S7UK17_ROSNE|nr:hypothetical protein SAMD00023353_0202770 [Rosellinia necatrix]